jgi:hypothetical protein
MSVTVLQLLPNLKQIQKILETNFVKYGSTIQIDPVSNGNVPSKHKNITTITQINRELLKYGAAKDRVNKLAKFNSVKAWLFQSIIIVLVCIVIVIFTFKVHFSKSKIWNLKSTMSVSKYFILYLIGMILLIWILYASIHYTKGYISYNRIVNNIDDFQNTGNIINNVVKILDVKPINNGKTFEINKANPLYLHFFAAKYGEDRIKDVRGKKKNAGGEEEEEIIKPFEMKTDDVVIKEADNKLYPFVGVDAIDPFVFKKDLQKFDYFNQMSLLEQAVKAFEVMLSKTNNVDLKVIYTDPLVIQSNILDILMKADGLSEKQAEYSQDIVDMVVSSDRSQTYLLDENDIKGIVFTLKGLNDVNMDEGAVTSILNLAAPLIEKVRLGNKENDESKFITYNDFVEKLSVMSSKEFVINVAYNAEKIRAATSGIAEFNTLYNTSVLYDTKMSIAKTSLIILGIVMILCIILLVMKTYESLESVFQTGEDAGPTEKFTDEELKKACTDVFDSITNSCTDSNNTNISGSIPVVAAIPISRQSDVNNSEKGLLGDQRKLATTWASLKLPGEMPNAIPNLVPTSIPTEMSNAIPNGIQNLTPNGIQNLIPNGIQNLIPNASSNEPRQLGGGEPGEGGETELGKMAGNTRKIFVITIIACSSILFYIILWSLYNKNVAFHTYNETMMDDNSFIMQTKALSVMQAIYDDAKKDIFGIKEMGLTEEKIVNLMKENIRIDITKKHDEGASDVPGDLLFEVIVNSSSVDDQNFIKLRSSRNNLNDVYSSLCEIVSSYNKCNNIYALAQNGVPFPWTSIVVYIIMLLICGVSIIMIADEFNVANARVNITRVNYIKQIMKEVGKTTKLSNKDITYINNLVQNLESEGENSSDSKRVVLFITGIVIMLAVTILFSIVITNEPQLYTSALYSSKQFRANECFD